MIIQDLFKLGLHALVENRASHKRRFLDLLTRPLHPQPLR
jgi:hypothetical protein